MLRFPLYGASLTLALAIYQMVGPASGAERHVSPRLDAREEPSRHAQTAQSGSEATIEADSPAAEPPARDYLVYFDFNKTDIRPDAASVLDRVAKAIITTGAESVTLIGHADTAGHASYNQWLSEQRTFAVHQYLLGKGIAAEVIAKGRGEEDPRVSTSDGVEEQENRRVEIEIN